MHPYYIPNSRKQITSNMTSEEKEDKEWRRFKKMGYPMPPTMELRLSREEIEAIMDLTSHLGEPPFTEIFKKAEKEWEQYMRARRRRYERPWVPADDF